MSEQSRSSDGKWRSSDGKWHQQVQRLDLIESELFGLDSRIAQVVTQAIAALEQRLPDQLSQLSRGLEQTTEQLRAEITKRKDGVTEVTPPNFWYSDDNEEVGLADVRRSES